MGQRSFRQIMRSRIAPVAFLAALLLLAVRTCGTEMAEVELHFDFGEAAPRLRAFHVDVHRGDDVAPVAFHTADYGDGGAPRGLDWDLQLDAGLYRLKIKATTSAGAKRIERRVSVTDRARVIVNLEADLLAPQ